MTAVKICGVRTAEHALAAVEAGAAMIGFILAPSRRQISPEQLAAITSVVRAAPGGRSVQLTGVFVNEAPERIAAIATSCGLDAVQLSGDEPTDVLTSLTNLTLIKALRLTGEPIERAWIAAAHQRRVRLLIDAHVPGTYGGAGVRGDWEAAAQLAASLPIMLAGGLTPENVAEAIECVHPQAVDVSSGVETSGVKDPARIRAFVRAVRAVAPGDGAATEHA